MYFHTTLPVLLLPGSVFTARYGLKLYVYLELIVKAFKACDWNVIVTAEHVQIFQTVVDSHYTLWFIRMKILIRRWVIEAADPAVLLPADDLEKPKLN
jgi:hypothetical protein